MTVEELLELTCGINEDIYLADDDKIKACISGILGKIKNEDLVEDENVVSLNAVFNIYRQGTFVILDADFFEENSYDLKMFHSIVMRYLLELDQYVAQEIEDIERLPILTFNIMPKNTGNDSCIQLTNPVMFSLTAKDTGLPVSCLRLLFNIENVQFMFAEDVDYTDFEMELMSEEMEKQYIQEQYEKRKEIRNNLSDNIYLGNLKN